MSMCCDSTACTDGLPHFLLLFSCTQIQENHIHKAKEGSVIHKPAEKRPGGGKKKKSHFYLPSMLTVGTFPYIASLITQK